MKSKTLVFTTLLFALLGSSVAFAEPVRIQPSQPVKARFDYNFSRRHDFGFAASIDFGLGYAAFYSGSPTSLSELDEVSSGLAFIVSGNAGWNVIENLTVGGSIFSVLSISDAVIGGGINARYWFADSGLSFAVTTGPATLSVRPLGMNFFDAYAWAFQPTISYSTWVSDQFYISLSAVGGASTFPFSTTDPFLVWWAAGSLSVGFN